MKKYFLMLLSLMFVTATSVGIVSCGDDDEEVVPANETTSSNEPDSSSEPSSPEGEEFTSKLSPEEQKFVGYWGVATGSGYHTFIFLPNGKAVRDNESYGQWQYNPQTGILATTIDMWQFNVTAIFEDAWTGVTINTGRGVSAHRGNDADFLKSLLKLIDFSQKQSDGTTLNPLMVKDVVVDSHGPIERYFFEIGSKIKGYEAKGNYSWKGFTNIKCNYQTIVADTEFSFVEGAFGIIDRETYGRNIRVTGIDSDSPVLIVKKNYSISEHTSDYWKSSRSTNITDNVDFPKEGTHQGKWKHIF